MTRTKLVVRSHKKSDLLRKSCEPLEESKVTKTDDDLILPARQKNALHFTENVVLDLTKKKVSSRNLKNMPEEDQNKASKKR